MSLNDFKDWLFNLLNEVDADTLADIETKDKLNTFQLSMDKVIYINLKSARCCMTRLILLN